MADEPKQRISIEELILAQKRNEEVLHEIKNSLLRMESLKRSGLPAWMYSFWVIAGPICWLLSNASVPSSVAFGAFCLLVLTIAILKRYTAQPGPFTEHAKTPEDLATIGEIRGNVVMAAIIFGIVFSIAAVVVGVVIATSK